jgi:glutamate racemase
MDLVNAMYDKNDYIAVFDSGVGGISVLRHLVEQMPNERFLYFGDSANAPYGTRSTEEIRALTFAAAERLLSRNVKALVLACNTATAAAAKALRLQYTDTIIIGIEPALKPAAEAFPHGTVAILATPATLREGKLERLIARVGGECHVEKIPAPGLVELIEHGLAESPATEALLRVLLEPWQGKLDGIVLGCTHYPFAAEAIGRILPDTVIFDGGAGTARNTRRRLAEAGLLRTEGEGCVIFENSADDPEMLRRCQQLLKG